MLQNGLSKLAVARGVLVASTFVCATYAGAQDTRTVAEPKIPTSCIKLTAQLSSTGDTLAGATLRESDESKPDTQRLQDAISSFAGKCKPGEAVELAPGANGTNAFLSGPLELKEGMTLLVDKGVTLFASRHAADYDISGPGTCGTMPANGRCKPFITIRAKNVSIMGDGVIDGRGGAKLLDKPFSWWALAVQAEPNNTPYSDPRLIDAANADGFTMYRITLHDSPNFHVGVSHTDGFTAWGVHLKTPVHQPGPSDPRPRNTDGIDPGSSSNVTIAHSWIDNGDDNIAIKTGVTHMSVLDNHFYSGHGMSIGSDTYSGDSYLLVDGLTEDHTTSGIRIKSNVTRGGEVHDLLYKNVCMRDVQIPIAISPYYNNGTVDQFYDPGFKGNKIPDYKKITIQNVTDLNTGDVLIAGYDEAHRTQVDLKNVSIQGITPDKLHLKYADIGVAGTNIPFEKATDKAEVKLIPGSASGSAYSCSGKFVPMR